MNRRNLMSTTQPIKDRSSLDTFKNYYLLQKPNPRNYTLIILGLNTALRISDILQLTWDDVYDGRAASMRRHLEVREKKTGKTNIIALNDTLCRALLAYRDHTFSVCAAKTGKDRGGYSYDSSRFLFPSCKRKNFPLSRYQAFRIIKEAAAFAGLPSHVSPHSLRKTFGYHAWKQGIPPALLMDIYNHSSYRITKRYLCIEQDERDDVYRNILL